MPPKAAGANAARRKGPAFNPPRPVNAAPQASSSTTAKRAPAPVASRATAAANKKNAFQPATDVIDLSDDDAPEEPIDQIDSDDFDSIMEDVGPATAPARSKPPPAKTTLSDPVVPRPLLARLLLENFEDPDMQIQTGAMKLVGKYIDIFVTEAFLRSKDERKTTAKNGGLVDGFLQVEDLEKLAPQLVLDF
ncbi:hypothetical protein COCVIDRAFT_24709 [Bipolaris victoriae FI3]|uniref:Cenp-s complex centromere protein x protein n=1 Tax=Bipolaris victoriae (strain FI3) TaxID=930091 RepID=W7EZH9_BIPV3|nr:hypothetical protein COCVIDRAFT_24709 [Bipolaris victoriae FI3]